MNNHQISALILDMDGVLWRDTEWLVEPRQTFERIRASGLRFAMATNNATRTSEYYLEKFASAGVTLEPWQVINSGIATAKYLQAIHPDGGEVFIVGEWGLERTLADHGFSHGNSDPLAVVCGLDRAFTYDKLTRASLLIQDGIPFIGTNPDRTFPTPVGLIPGAGSVLAAIQAASGVDPLIIGKPKPTMYRQLLPDLGSRPENTLVVGDRLDTDIEGAQSLGCQSALVLTGVSSLEAAQAWHPLPDMIEPDLTAVLDLLLA